MVESESDIHPGDDFLELECDAGLHDPRVLADRVGDSLLDSQAHRLLVVKASMLESFSFYIFMSLIQQFQSKAPHLGLSSTPELKEAVVGAGDRLKEVRHCIGTHPVVLDAEQGKLESLIKMKGVDFTWKFSWKMYK